MTATHESVDLVEDRVVGYFAMAVFVAALTAALAQFTGTLPVTPVDVTLQTAGVFAAGLLLGPVWGAFALVLYLCAGVAGAPVFAGGGAGLGVVLGPTGGYLLSFPLAAALIGGIVHRCVTPRRLDDASLPLQAGAILVGLTVVYLLGSLQLAFVSDLPVPRALIQGGLIFLPADAAKAVAVLGLLAGDHIVQGDHLPT